MTTDPFATRDTPYQRMTSGSNQVPPSSTHVGDADVQRVIDGVDGFMFGREQRLRQRLRLSLVAAGVYTLSLLAQ